LPDGKHTFRVKCVICGQEFIRENTFIGNHQDPKARPCYGISKVLEPVDLR
jgi:hypothetical protein